MADWPPPAGSAGRTIWVDEKNGKRPWSAAKVGWLVAFPLMALLTVVATPWAVGHIEDRLTDEAEDDLEAAGIDTADLDIDFDYRDGEATGSLPAGVSVDAAETAVDARMLRSFSVVADEVPAIVGTTDVVWRQVDGKITLSGEVETEADRDALLDAAALKVGADFFVDELTVSGADAPGDGSARIEALISTLTAVVGDDTITATLTDDSLTVDGTVATAAAATSVRANAARSLIDDVVVSLDSGDASPDGNEEDDETVPVDDPPAVGTPLAIQVTYNGGVATVSGSVGTEAQKEQILVAARSLAPVIVDRIGVAPDGDTSATADERVAAVATTLERLDGAGRASIDLADDQLIVDAAGPTTVVRDLRRLDDDLPAVDVVVTSTLVLVVPPSSDTEEIEALQAELDGLAAEIRENVLFTTGSAQLHAAAEETLDKVVAALERYPSPLLEVAGHTDNLGSADLNRRLSEERAAAVVAYLTGAGIDGSRLTARGIGPDEPIADNNTAEGRALNRRVEFTASTSD